MSRSFRVTSVPQNIVVLWHQSGSIPTGYGHECSLYNKIPVEVSTSCTNPGGSVGSDTHTETSGGASHCHPGTTSSHTHSLSYGTNSSAVAADGSGYTMMTNHSHSGTSSSGSTNVSLGNASFAHTHDSQSLLPPYITSRYLKHNDTSLKMKSKQLPINTVIMYSKNISTVPDNWGIHCSYNTKYVRGVPDCSTSPGSTGGSTTHQHAGCSAAHTHGQTISSHSHSPSINSTTPGSASTGHWATGGASRNTHSHSTGSISISSASGSAGNSATSQSHQHSSNNNEPSYHELAYINHNSISMRAGGIMEGGIVGWLNTLATIPSGFANTDGTVGTINLIDKYVKGIATNCTNPGTTGGSSTHQHDAQTHTHDGSSASHSHSMSGSTGSYTSGNISGRTIGVNRPGVSHNHPAGGVGGAGGTYNPTAAGSHQHNATSNKPASIEIAYIQKL